MVATNSTVSKPFCVESVQPLGESARVEHFVKSRQIIPFTLLAICLLVGMTIWIRRSGADVLYRGQPLRTWTVQACQGNSNAVAVMQELGTNAISGLIQLLKTRDSFLRKQTWTHLPKLPLQVRRTIAQKYPPPQSETVRGAAAKALGRLGTNATAAVPALSMALRDNDGRVRWEAATALGSIGKDSVLVLITSLEEEDARTRHAAAYALGQIGSEASQAVPALARSLNDQDMAVRNSSSYSLAAIGAGGVLALLDVAEHGPQPARLAAMNTLTNSYLPALTVTREFFRMAKSESPEERRQAIVALGAIGPVGSSAVYASLEALDDPALEVRLAAIQTLGARAGTNQNAVQALIECLKAESPRVREEAARALGSIADAARAAVPELARLTQDKEESVRVAAKTAMEKIGQEEFAPPRAN
jgi:HEAT repeat protein